MRAHVQEVASTAAAASESSSSPAAAADMEERYVKAASRFFREDPSMTRVVHHYLESCFLCKRDISCDRDIFMCKGDAAFCSEECRQEQMDMDDALHAVARRHRRLLQQRKPPSAEPAGATAAAARRETAPAMKHRRPTIADLAARTPVAAG